MRLRPHTKTHKSPYIARRQLDAGACGITVAKLGEAEVMAAAGIEDIRIVYPIVGERKLARLVTLLHRASISIALDSHDVATQLSAAAVAAHTSLPVLLEIDTGFHRLGVQPDEAASVAKSLSRLPGIRLAGVLTHEGQVSPAVGERSHHQPVPRESSGPVRLHTCAMPDSRSTR